jgi:hypothetical protein
MLTKPGGRRSRRPGWPASWLWSCANWKLAYSARRRLWASGRRAAKPGPSGAGGPVSVGDLLDASYPSLPLVGADDLWPGGAGPAALGPPGPTRRRRRLQHRTSGKMANRPPP